MGQDESTLLDYERIRHQIDSMTPAVDPGEWTRTEIVTLSLTSFLLGFAECLAQDKLWGTLAPEAGRRHAVVAQMRREINRIATAT